MVKSRRIAYMLAMMAASTQNSIAKESVRRRKAQESVRPDRRPPRETRDLQNAQSNVLIENHASNLSCKSNEQLFNLNLQTDSFGRETSWSLQHQSDNGRKYVDYGPPDGVRYGDLTVYSFEYCLKIGETYLLSLEDNFGDGMCCDRGYGAYEFSLGDTLIYSSDFEKTFNDYVEHVFTVGEIYTRAPTLLPVTTSPTIKVNIGDPTMSPIPPTKRPTVSPTTPNPSASPTSSPTPFPTKQPTNKPSPGYDVYNEDNGCYGGDIKVKVEVRADEFSNDTSWHIIDYHTGEKKLKQRGYTFEQYEYKMKETCVPPGKYNFTIWDEYGDGICCRYGQGFFKVSLDGVVVLSGGSFNDNVTEVLHVGYDPIGYMTQRDIDYLEAHNTRRKQWHERYNLTYVPLRYSPALAQDAQDWAEELLHACGVVGIEHEDFSPYGENLAKNVGANGWGQLYPADSIVGRWVEFEIGLQYPSNGHLTQVLWRASQYLGCGESAKEYRNGMCRVQVCRYARAGNCDMKRFNATYGENWLDPTLNNYTRCGPNCPPEGCF